MTGLLLTWCNGMLSLKRQLAAWEAIYSNLHWRIDKRAIKLYQSFWGTWASPITTLPEARRGDLREMPDDFELLGPLDFQGNFLHNKLVAEPLVSYLHLTEP